ncbi:L-aspartate oxidase [Rhizobium paknamense]|uniref:L-aspartate oxidase n=1 Tax=Rhizobium paknamense TaxID=1206817 RepID=A0ABU0IFK2_9HYPH|nr:L-aspartate oxidase [Rhizobium paknamense]MDQ0455994.1 L-aspartate oxidase [Rhizobium paknamense]
MSSLPDNPVIVVGSGLAGLMTALCLAPQPVVVVTRAGLGEESSSQWAQGGIAAALGEDDDAALHAEDTLAAGDGLCDSDAVHAITGAAREAIATLEGFGVVFDRDGQGRLALGLEAAHGRRRIVHAAGDSSGAEILRAMVRAARATPSIHFLEHHSAERLLTTDGRMAGLVVAGQDGERKFIAASRVVLATGGLGGLFQATTNPAGNFGQGIVLAARAGAKLADMEFVQFHPTALAGRTRPLALVSEAVRGEGALLVNDRGERFMSTIAGQELAPRDVVARAISAELATGRRVFLDARQALGERFGARFPAIHTLCRATGVDPARDLIPVSPAAHYHMGGVATDLRGRSSVPGLWAAGEVACTGLHGANRLASNSLLEAAVMGQRVAEDIRRAPVVMPSFHALPSAECAVEDEAVRPIVSRHFGVIRHAAGLYAALEELLPMVEEDGPATQPALVALLIGVFAYQRRESRGGHARSDFPLPQPRSQRQIMTLSEALAAARAILSHPEARSA